MIDTWLEQAASGTVEPAAEESLTYAELANPCDRCASYCCKYLVFPGMTPTSSASLDYMKFLLAVGIIVGIVSATLYSINSDWTIFNAIVEAFKPLASG